jgi:hypothetical protein
MASSSSIDIKDGQITAHFSIFTKELTEGETHFSCYIPNFDIFYSVSSEENIEKRGKSMLKSFFHFWLKREGKRAFFLELHKKGFRTTNHQIDMKKILNSEKNSAVFNSDIEKIEGYKQSKENVTELSLIEC